jgi:tetratricopeptide (TPR) repeat protein
MVTTKNRAAHHAGLALLLVTALGLGGCQPSASRALNKGDQLLRKGRHAEAVQQFETAVRLLPQSAPAWNHLGLAYHGHGQWQDAQRAYQKALALDHKLAAAHYNLGCLYLEQTNLSGALAELTTFTGLESASLDGWLKLAAAQLRAGRLDAAEKSYRVALELHPRHPEALNGLGVVKHQRRRPQEALDLFNAALAQQPDYGPALLNVAVVLHQTLNQRARALQKYRQYLALTPRPANWTTVDATARQLEAELNSTAAATPSARSTPSLVLTPSPPASAVVATQAAPLLRPANPREPTTPSSLRTATPPVVASAGPSNRSSPPPTASSSSARAPSPAATPPSAPATVARADAASTPRPPPDLLRPVPPATNRAPELHVTRVPEDLTLRPAMEIAPPESGASETAVSALDATPPVAVTSRDTRPPRRPFLSRINPFKGRTTATTNTIVITPRADQVGAGAAATETAAGTAVPPPPPAAVSPRVIARYDYLSPAKPAAGDRVLAERLLREGVSAQQAGKLSQALAQYRAAVRADPGFFEARFNEGLAAYELGNFKQSLEAYEYALAIQPDSVDARYNLALALKRANYLLDAAAQLERLLASHPNEARAHYSLATLYAHQLDAPDRAQPHFQKVLELQPRHPDAGQIRFWLAQRP